MLFQQWYWPEGKSSLSSSPQAEPAACLRNLLLSNSPFQSLQCGGSFVRPSNRLAFLAVANAHQNGDILKSLFDKREVMTEQNFLLRGKRT